MTKRVSLAQVPSIQRMSLYVFLLMLGLPFIFFVENSCGQEISQTAVYASVKKIAAAINENYFDIELASQIQRDLQLRLSQHKFDNIKNAQELADQLTARLMQLTKDKHLVVSPRELESQQQPTDMPSGVDEEQATADRVSQRALAGKRSNFGIQKFEILPGNIAYLNFTSFYRENEIAEILAAEMKLAANADAIILDMRFNMGGSTGAIALLSSYFFEGPKRKLFDVVPRSGKTRTYFTDPTVLNRNGSRPVYVLVHSTTFSAGEGLAFLMQDQKRATVVGERTAGAANPGRPYYANDWFEVNVPNGQVKAANSGKNWEGTGVIPDVNSNGQDALLIAHRLAIKKLISQTTDETYLAKLKTIETKLNSWSQPSK